MTPRKSKKLRSLKALEDDKAQVSRKQLIELCAWFNDEIVGMAAGPGGTENLPHWKRGWRPDVGAHYRLAYLHAVAKMIIDMTGDFSSPRQWLRATRVDVVGKLYDGGDHGILPSAIRFAEQYKQTAQSA